MFVSCFFCSRPFRSNGSIGSSGIGRTFAFEPRKGRVWVVCESCNRWNLLPEEERPHVLEDCERRFADTRTRACTENIALANLRDGTRLVRVGEASPREIVGWRYGATLIKRRVHLAARLATGAATVGAMLYLGLVPSVVAIGVIAAVANVASIAFSRRTCATLRVGDRQVRLSRHSIAHVELRPNADEGFEMRVPYLERGQHDLATFELWAKNWFASSKYSSIVLPGKSGWNPARAILPILNSAGGSPADIAEAMTLIDMYPTPEQLWKTLAETKRSSFPALWGHERGGSAHSVAAFRLGRLTTAQRLALEISLQETLEDERSDYALGDFQGRWREASEVAGIADRLLEDDSAE